MPEAMISCPEQGLEQHMCLAVSGDWAPGRVDGNPMLVAVYLEYLRRGGETPAQAGAYRQWLAANTTSEQITAITSIANQLEQLSTTGAPQQAFHALLDPWLEEL